MLVGPVYVGLSILDSRLPPGGVAQLAAVIAAGPTHATSRPRPDRPGGRASADR
jgi:hypothetical protein